MHASLLNSVSLPWERWILSCNYGAKDVYQRHREGLLWLNTRIDASSFLTWLRTVSSFGPSITSTSTSTCLSKFRICTVRQESLKSCAAQSLHLCKQEGHGGE